MPSTSITWKAVLDERTCPICRAMHGYKWTFTVKEGVPDELVHPQFGVVWNVSRGSQAHGHQRYNCRCTIIPEVNVADLKRKIDQLLRATEQNLRFEVFTRYGKPVGVYREVETGRFTARP
jgi:uncharacterized protein with gpF-like domain